MRTATLAFAFALVIAASSAALARGHGHRDQENGTAGRFDYYLMSLSWSPSFCATHPGETEQCGTHGFGFVLHGLWPQYRNGSWPQQCSSDAHVDEATIARTLAFMPSRHLIEHEWATHGTCTGLDPRAYFDLADHAFASVIVPEALRAPRTPPQLSAGDLVDAFVAANPGLSRDMISVECHDGAELTEVHVCLSRDDLAPQACGGGMRNTCRLGTLRIVASR
jgi:ribonuclease T2